MKLDIITVCVDYADFLAVTLPEAMKHGRVTVATAPKDLATIELCKHHGVACVVTDAWYQDGDPFNKGAGINAALEARKPEGWLLSMDADIVLPPAPRNGTPIAQLDKQCMYGARRLECERMDRWEECLREGNYFDLPLSPLPRIGKNGRVWGSRPTRNPIAVQGYFQLWHYGERPYKLYEWRDARKCDVSLALKFKDRERKLIPWPKYQVIHLGIRKKNWRGRLTETWSTCTIPSGDLERAAEKHYE